MAVFLALLLIALVFGLGFLVKALWIVAFVLLIAWLLGFFFARSGSSEGRWYRW